MNTEQMQGCKRVKEFNDSSDIDFIREDGGGGKDEFAHRFVTQVEDLQSCQERDQVEFKVVQGAKGPAAKMSLTLKC